MAVSIAAAQQLTQKDAISFITIIFPLSFALFYSFPSYLPSLAWKSKLNVQSQLLVPFCYNLYDLGDITLSSESVFLYHKQEMDTQAEYLYI